MVIKKKFYYEPIIGIWEHIKSGSYLGRNQVAP